MDEPFPLTLGDDAERSPSPITDVLGIGFGPSNLALAIALQEHDETAALPLTARFLERKPRFSWHRGHAHRRRHHAGLVPQGPRDPAQPVQPVQLPVATCTTRTGWSTSSTTRCIFPSADRVPRLPGVGAPRSSATWSLRPRGRRPSRPVARRRRRAHFEVVHATADGEPRVAPARNLVRGARADAAAPAGHRRSASASGTATRCSPDSADSRSSTPGGSSSSARGRAPPRSSTTCTARFPTAEICALFARFGYSQADDSPFANRIFDPERRRHFHGAPETVKRDAHELPRQHQLLRRRRRPHRGPVPAALPGARARAWNGCGCSTCRSWSTTCADDRTGVERHRPAPADRRAERARRRTPSSARRATSPPTR